MEAILIVRVRTEEQKEAGYSLPAQVARLEKYCQLKDFPIIKSFSFDESGYKIVSNFVVITRIVF
jgi:DNA invertase Pin-like site-specific DNA recombinase